MFKLVVIFAVMAVAAAKPGFLSAPALALAPAIETRTAIIGEKTVESHGNSIVHASAPVVTSYAAPAVATYAAAAPVITSYAAAAPAIATYAAAPAITSYSAPLIYGAHFL